MHKICTEIAVLHSITQVHPRKWIDMFPPLNNIFHTHTEKSDTAVCKHLRMGVATWGEAAHEIKKNESRVVRGEERRGEDSQPPDHERWESSEQAELKMDPNYPSEKSGKGEQPPAYQADMGYPPAQGFAPPQGGYPPAQGYGSAPYGAQPYTAQPYGGQPAYPGQAAVTVQPTVYVTQGTPINPVPDYLGYSIFTMLCCCLPLGIAALIYSINVSRSNARRLPLIFHSHLVIYVALWLPACLSPWIFALVSEQRHFSMNSLHDSFVILLFLI